MTTTPAEIKNGRVIFYDEDGEPFSLSAEQAIAIAEAVEDNRQELERSSHRWTIAGGLDVVRSLLLDTNLPQPRNICAYDNYDPTVDVDFVSDDDAIAWAERLGFSLQDRASHPTLGHRVTGRHGSIVLSGPWDRIVEPVEVPA